MSELIKFRTEEILPEIDDITLAQGIPKSRVITECIKDLIDQSIELFLTDADPLCIIKEISKNNFEEIYYGDGNNDEEAPLKFIFTQADHLSLYAITMGIPVSHRITKLFEDKDFAIASMLDTVASLAADKSVYLLEKRIDNKLEEEKRTGKSSMVLSYSPGYCGWHISAQKKIFSYLNPGEIGITLNESCLMTPLKSVTGVLVGGNKNIHDFENSFSFCYNCKAQSCIERRERILSH